MSNEDYINTYSGKKFYPLEPEKSEFLIEDIAHALSNMCRFAGHCNQFYSVAQHSVLVSNYVSTENALWGLLHDATEAYLSDIPRPIKRLAEFSQYRKIENETMKAIAKNFNIGEIEPEEVKTMDSLILRNEAKCFNILTPELSIYKLKDLNLEIVALHHTVAKKQFLDAFARIVKFK